MTHTGKNLFKATTNPVLEEKMITLSRIVSEAPIHECTICHQKTEDVKTCAYEYHEQKKGIISEIYAVTYCKGCYLKIAFKGMLPLTFEGEKHSDIAKYIADSNDRPLFMIDQSYLKR